MKAFRVTKGTSTRMIALKNPGVLSATIYCHDNLEKEEEVVELEMGGLDSLTREHVSWNRIDLVAGDQVTIEVIENCEGDEPDEIRSEDPEDMDQRMKQYVRDTAKKLGWTIVEND